MVFIVKIPNHNRSRGTTPDPEVAPPPALPVTPGKEQPPPPSKAAALDVLLAPEVLHHRYLRGVDKSLIVERPERVRAVLLGIAGAIGKRASQQSDDDDLVSRLSSLSVQGGTPCNSTTPVRVLHSTRSLSLDPPHPSVAYVHAHSEETVAVLEPAYDLAKRKRAGLVTEEVKAQTSHSAYLSQLCSKAPSQAPLPLSAPPPRPITSESDYTSSDGEGDEALHLSEIPEHLPQGDLYLAGPSAAEDQGGSSSAIRHAMGACAEAVDRVVAASLGAASSPLAEFGHEPHPPAAAAKRAFVLSRPPGHHCAGNTPSGFCWVNNAVVAASHAYHTHGIDRVVILDIDLHHGNGTQSLAWRINADAQRADLEGQSKRALRLFYGSIHDIESFPCEDGDETLVKDASTCVEGAHGQWIWNVHLNHYASQADFDRLYAARYAVLFDKAARFLSQTGATAEGTLVLISAGFDACSYEYPGMQRHGKHVPPSFYHTFARDAVAFADRLARGKLVSVLEGGYSDRALCSAAMAHVMGLADQEADDEWKLESLVQLEKMAKRVANPTATNRSRENTGWIADATRAFIAFEGACGKEVGTQAVKTPTVQSPSGRVLRDRSARSTPRASAATPKVTSPRNKRSNSPKKPVFPSTEFSPPQAVVKSDPFPEPSSQPEVAAKSDSLPEPSKIDPPSPEATTSRIGSVTPKAVSLNADPIMLVDAMKTTFPSAPFDTHSTLGLSLQDQD